MANKIIGLSNLYRFLTNIKALFISSITGKDSTINITKGDGTTTAVTINNVENANKATTDINGVPFVNGYYKYKGSAFTVPNSSSNDFNNLLDVGYYYVFIENTAPKNSPVGLSQGYGSRGYLYVTAPYSTKGDYPYPTIQQTYITSYRIYTRTKEGSGGFNAWVTIETENSVSAKYLKKNSDIATNLTASGDGLSIDSTTKSYSVYNPMIKFKSQGNTVAIITYSGGKLRPVPKIEGSWRPDITSEGYYVTNVSPTFVGTPTAPTPIITDSSSALATTEFVKQQNYITKEEINTQIGVNDCITAMSLKSNEPATITLLKKDGNTSEVSLDSITVNKAFRDGNNISIADNYFLGAEIEEYTLKFRKGNGKYVSIDLPKPPVFTKEEIDACFEAANATLKNADDLSY